MIEPNPKLFNFLSKNLNDANLFQRSEIYQGLVGKQEGESKLYVNPKNYLTSSIRNSDEQKMYYSVPYFNLNSKLIEKGFKKIDIMKIDIEGGEFEFIEYNSNLLSITELLVMEIHQSSKEQQEKILKQIEQQKLFPYIGPIKANGQDLIIFKRKEESQTEQSLTQQS